jgi:hypothetical protein
MTRTYEVKRITNNGEVNTVATNIATFEEARYLAKEFKGVIIGHCTNYTRQDLINKMLDR